MPELVNWEIYQDGFLASLTVEFHANRAGNNHSQRANECPVWGRMQTNSFEDKPGCSRTFGKSAASKDQQPERQGVIRLLS